MSHRDVVSDEKQGLEEGVIRLRPVWVHGKSLNGGLGPEEAEELRAQAGITPTGIP